MNIILNFSDDTKTSNTITELIRLNNDQLNIDSIIKTIYGKLNEIVAKTLDLIDRNIYLQIIKNQNVQLIKIPLPLSIRTDVSKVFISISPSSTWINCKSS